VGGSGIEITSAKTSAKTSAALETEKTEKLKV
jgi:hypothetical protein